jgi:hypothetical protein
MKVFVVLAGFHYEGEQSIASFSDRDQAEQFRDYLEMSQKLGQAVADTAGYDYFIVDSVEVSNTWQEAVNRLEREQEEYQKMCEEQSQERFEELQAQQPARPTLADVFPTHTVWY